MYCTLYFDKKIAPKEFKFYIKEEKEEKYTNNITNIVHIEVEEDNVKEYCISEEETSEHCDWQEMNNKTIDSEYTFTNETNEEKKVYAYVRNEYELDTQKEDKITFDNVAPVIENLTVENINSRSYKGTISNITDNLSGVDKHYFSNSGSNYTEEIVDNITYSGTKGASGAVYAYATDKAGNESAIVNKSVTIGGTGTSADPYHIYYIEDLVDLQVAVNKGTTYAGKTFTLDRSLDFKTTGSYENSTRTNYGDINGTGGAQGLLVELTSGTGWKPIGNTDVISFQGIFDGKDYTLGNIYISNNVASSSMGLFGTIKNATINNLKISGAVKSSVDVFMGSIVGSVYGKSTFKNIESSASVTGTKDAGRIGGIIGTLNDDCDTNLNHLINRGTITEGNYTAGIMGWTAGTNAVIEDSHNYGKVLQSGTSTTSKAAGIIGTTRNNMESIEMNKCSNEATITGTGRTGGLIGSSNFQNSCTITDSYNTQQISGKTYTGGLVGDLGGGTITSSYNTANISGNGSGGNYVGGIVGYTWGTSLNISNSYNTGAITTPTVASAGIVGYVTSSSTVNISSSWNTGTITSNGSNSDHSEMIAGIVGGNYGTLTINKSYNTGQIQCKGTGSYLTGVAGIVGWTHGSTTFILNSYNTGNVSTVSGQAGGYSSGIGFVNYAGKLTIINSYNRGTILGGVKANVGMASTDGGTHGVNTLRIYNAYNKATVTGTNANGIDWHASGTTYVNNYTYNNPAAGQTFVNTLNTNKGKITLKSIDSSLSSYTLCNWKLGSDNYPALNC